jgi:hypothetical protein
MTIMLDGFSVETPPGWVVSESSKRAVLIGKLPVTKISQVGWAITGDTPLDISHKKTLEWAQEHKIEDSKNGSRLIDAKNKFERIKFQKLDCLKYEHTARDMTTSLTMKATGMTCIHPKLSHHYIDLSISQRYNPNDVPVDQAADIDSFFKSLTIR